MKSKLQFWYQERPHQADTFEESLVPVGLVDSVETFWAFYQHFKRPSQLVDHNFIYLFKEKIKPVWEDPANEYGGTFTLKFERDKVNKVYEDIILGFVALNTKEESLINGIRLKLKKDAIIEVWISDASDE